MLSCYTVCLVFRSEYFETSSTFNSRELILRQFASVSSLHMVFSQPAEGHLPFSLLRVYVFKLPWVDLVVTLLIIFLRRITVQHQNGRCEYMETARFMTTLENFEAQIL